ncbi:MAG: hypothetical protein ACI4G1_04260 [Ruminococcus sp.]
MKRKRLSAKVLSIILVIVMSLSVVTVGTFTANAINISYDSTGSIYFDNSVSQWSGDYVYFVMSHPTSQIYRMNRIEGTQLYYLNLSEITNGEYLDSLEGCWFLNCSREPDSSLVEYIAHSNSETQDFCRQGDFALNCTGQIDVFGSEEPMYSLSSEVSAIVKADNSEIGTTVTSSWYKNSYETYEKGIRVDTDLTVQVDNGSGTYVNADSSNSGGKVKFETTAVPEFLNGNYTVYPESAITDIGWNCFCGVIGGDVTFSLVSTYTDCEFKGWYDSDGNLISTDTSYTFYPSSSGQYYARFKVPETTRPSTTSATIQDVHVMFKGTSLSYLMPTMTLTDSSGTSTDYSMTRSTYIGTYINGAYQFYWYEAYIPSVTVGDNYKITFKTAGSNMEASMNLDFTDCPSDQIMYFGVDNLQTGTILENLSDNETAKSCFRSSVNMFTNVAGDSYDPTLTLAQVNVTADSSDSKETVSYVLGDCDMNSKLDIKDATKIQAMLTKSENVSSVQELLADFDVSGSAEIQDVSYIQMYLAKI